MNWHIIWLWLWFGVGMVTYMMKRAYFLVTGPNPVANNYRQFIERCWLPLLIRLVIDSGVYWATFTPQLLSGGLKALGWEAFATEIDSVTQLGVFSLFFGFGVDSIVDFAVTKIPWIKDILPQMPAPLPAPGSVTVTATQQTNTVEITATPKEKP